MTTPYQNIYTIFIRKITDYSFTNLTQGEFEDVILGFLNSSCAKFSEDCKVDLSDRNDTLKIFNVDLSDKEQEILGTMMIAEWLSPLVFTTEIAKQALTDRDFKIYSQSNHLKGLSDLMATIKEDIDSMITKYTWTKVGLEALR